MIPVEIESAPGGVAAAAGRYNRLESEARSARSKVRTLERDHALAERNDSRIQGEATAAGKKVPQRTAPALKVELDEARHGSEVAHHAAKAALRMLGSEIVEQSDTWLAEIDSAHADATADLAAALEATADAAQRIDQARAARSWLAACAKEFGPTGHGRIPSTPPHGATPMVQVGGHSWGWADLLGALEAWSAVNEPEPPSKADCAFCGNPFQPASPEQTFCMQRCATSARARAASEAERMSA